MSRSPEKTEDDPLPRSPQPLTLGKSKMSHRTSPLETGDSDSLLFQEGREISWHVTWPGRTSVLARVSGAPSPCDKSHFSCLSPLHQLPGLSSLSLPQHYAIMEKKRKKVRPWNRPEIQCLHMVPSCPLFSNEDALYDWGVTVKC